MQGSALPPVVFGLLQHETKLSVVNFSVRKAAGFEEVLPNKAPLLLVTGLRYDVLLPPTSPALGCPAMHTLPRCNHTSSLNEWPSPHPGGGHLLCSLSAN
jgi:pre-rRNA-processing protein TSR1